MTLSERFSAAVSAFTFDRLPQSTVEKTKLCVLHAFATTFAGRGERWSRAARETTAALQPAGDSSIWFHGQKSNMADAAFVNAVAAQSILHEDIHRESNAHPGIIIVPACFAVGEALKASGKTLLAAVAAGYEMMGRFGKGSVSPDFGRRGFRPTSIIGVFGSAAAAGLLLGLDPRQQANAFGLAANFASGINEWAIAGSDDIYYQNGMTARNGVIAAALAQRGVTAPPTVVEGASGFCNAYGYSLANLEAVDFNDGRFVIDDVLFKPAPACALVQATAQSALDAAAAGVRPEDIESGAIHTFALGKNYAGCDFPGPFTEALQARMSNQYNFAATLARGKIDNKNYHEFTDPVIAAAASRLTVTVDDALTAAFPVKQPVRVELRLKNGETKTFSRDEPTYLDREQVAAGFIRHLEPVCGAVPAAALAENILHLEKSADIRGITGMHGFYSVLNSG